MTQKSENKRLDEIELRDFYLEEQETIKRSSFLGMLGSGLMSIVLIAGSVSLFILKYPSWYGGVCAVAGAGFIWGFIKNLHWYKDTIENIILNKQESKIKQGNLNDGHY